jgi:hypothetical protein
MTDIPSPAGQTSTTEIDFEDAYVRLENELLALKPPLAVVNVDPQSAVTTVIGAMPRIRSLRTRIADELPRFDLVRFDKLPDYCLAFGHSNARFFAASRPVAPVAALAEEGAKIRDVLITDAQALKKRGLFDDGRLSELKLTVGHRPISLHLLSIAQMFREQWPKIQGKTAVTLEELDHAEKIAGKLTLAVGEKEVAGTAPTESAINRQKAFTLFIAAYNDARRAAVYLYGDEADSFVPNLYPGRTTTRKRSEEEPEEPVTTPAQPPVGATPAQPPADATPGLPPATGRRAVGMPDSDPFGGASN